MIGAVLANSDMYMHKVCQEMFGIIVYPPTICRLLHSYGITKIITNRNSTVRRSDELQFDGLNIRRIAIQLSYSLRGAFRALFDPDMFLFVGETAVDDRDPIRRYG